MPQLSPNFQAAGRAAKAFAVVACCSVLAAAGGAQAAGSAVRVSDAWMRLIIPARPAAGYFTLGNDGATPLVLVGAASPGCGMLMLHRSDNAGGVEQMAMVPSIPVPAHGSVAFAPGGYHLMCLSPAPSLRHGTTVPVTLKFADGDSVTAEFPVRNAIGK